MKASNITVLRKILYAVESGGQVYGKQNYAAFAGAAQNTSNEKAITIGAGQWYAEEGRKLLQNIQSKYPVAFKKLDTAGISADIQKSWATYSVTKTSVKGKCIIAIISSTNGIKCQDELMETQIKEYAASIEKTYGSMTDDGMMECINIRHQGGNLALKRVLAKTTKPYNAKNIYAALCTDLADKSSNNQVGDYQTRQKKVYKYITKYAIFDSDSKSVSTGGTTTMKYSRNVVVGIMQDWVGKKESDGSHKSIIDIYNTISPLPRGYKVQYTDAWCAATVSAAFHKAGYDAIFPSECGCYNMIQKAKTMGIWQENDAYIPSSGDCILYDWDDSGSGDDTGVPEHVGMVEKVSGSIITVIEGNKNNAVGRRTIEVNGRYIRGFVCPKFTITGTVSTSVPKESATSNAGTAMNKTVKWTGTVTASALNVRTWAGVENKACSFSPLSKGTKVAICDSVKASDGVKWYYIKYNGKYGFVSSKYISK